MCVKVIASQRWDVFLRHGVDANFFSTALKIENKQHTNVSFDICCDIF